MHLSNNQKLFAQYVISLLEEMYKRSNELLTKTCDPVRNDNKQKIIDELSRIMFRYNIKYDSLKINKLDQHLILKDLSEKINDMFNHEYLTEKMFIEDLGKSVAADSYYINSFIASIGIDYTLKPVSDKKLKSIINQKIDDEIWSNRLWNNKKSLRADIKLQVKKFLSGETNVNDIGNIIEKKYSNNKYVTSRLVNTEICRIQSSANEVWASKHNIQYQLFMATLDNKTSKTCREHDGKVYAIGDSNKPICPLHPFCRSALVNIPNKDWRPSYRLVNGTRERIKWTDYETWKNNNKVGDKR